MKRARHKGESIVRVGKRSKAARKVDRLASVDYIEQIFDNLWNYMETGSSGLIRRLSAVWRIWMASQSQ